jgi:hypothetical protein
MSSRNRVVMFVVALSAAAPLAAFAREARIGSTDEARAAASQMVRQLEANGGSVGASAAIRSTVGSTDQVRAAFSARAATSMLEARGGVQVRATPMTTDEVRLNAARRLNG